VAARCRHLDASASKRLPGDQRLYDIIVFQPCGLASMPRRGQVPQCDAIKSTIHETHLMLQNADMCNPIDFHNVSRRAAISRCEKTQTQCMLSSTPYYVMPCPTYPQQYEFKTELVSESRNLSPLPSSRTTRQTGWSGTSSSTIIS
jgi:hypothetical protein